MLALDVTSDDSVVAVVGEVLRRSGRIDLLVNNAGFGVGLAGDEESSVAQAQAIFDTNFFGTVRMTRAVVPHMRRQAAGRILNIGSGLDRSHASWASLFGIEARTRRLFRVA
jgi:NAD(P)-dependent dehydrogenase (short-subunit alcohol dehydrogenase family)